MDKMKQFFEEVEKSSKGIICRKFIESLDINNQENDYIDKYLNYWILYNFGFKKNEIDKLWLNDNQSHLTRRNKKELCADTIFSLWGPLKHIIELINEKENIKDTYNKNLLDLLSLKENKQNIFTDKYKDIYNALNEFAKYAMSEANVIEYPINNDSKTNPKKINFNTYRGNKKTFNDLFLISLNNCYDRGVFSVCFNETADYKNVDDWINAQSLNCFFQGKDIISITKERNGKTITLQDKDTKSWKQHKLDLDDMICILEKYCNILKNREKELKKNDNKKI